MIQTFHSRWFVALVGCLSYLTTTALVWKPPHVALRETAAAFVGEKGASWNFTNPEVDQLVMDLKEEKELVARRQKQLDELETRLKAEWQEICQTTQTVYRMQQEFDRVIVRVKEEETANLKKLAKVYAAMTPDAAATVLKEMPDEQVVKILVFLKDSETATLLEVLARKSPADARRAAQLSERLRFAVYRNPGEKKKS